MSNRIGIRAWIDFAFKKIFGKPGNEICLISFLNSVLDLRRPIASVEFLNPFSLREFEEAKLICVDVKATDTDRQLFIVEMQIVVSASFSKRAVYYASRAYIDQLAPGQGYGTLKATYAVCLLMQPLWHDDRLHHHFRLAEKESGEVLQDAIEIHTVELSKYNLELGDVSQANVLEQWCYWIKYSHEHTEEELLALLPGLPFLQATRELNAIREVTEEKQMYDAREKAALDLESGLIDAREEGREEGLEKGREEGREEGLKKGILAGKIQMIEDLLGQSATSISELETLAVEELESQMVTLQARLRNRPV